MKKKKIIWLLLWEDFQVLLFKEQLKVNCGQYLKRVLYFCSYWDKSYIKPTKVLSKAISDEYYANCSHEGPCINSTLNSIVQQLCWTHFKAIHDILIITNQERIPWQNANQNRSETKGIVKKKKSSSHGRLVLATNCWQLQQIRIKNVLSSSLLHLPNSDCCYSALCSRRLPQWAPLSM